MQGLWWLENPSIHGSGPSYREPLTTITLMDRRVTHVIIPKNIDFTIWKHSFIFIDSPTKVVLFRG